MGSAYSSFVIWFESLPVLGGFLLLWEKGQVLVLKNKLELLRFQLFQFHTKIGLGIQFQIQFFKKTKFLFQFEIQFFRKTKFWFQFSFWFWKWIPIEIQFLGMGTAETGVFGGHWFQSLLIFKTVSWFWLQFQFQFQTQIIESIIQFQVTNLSPTENQL